jgi:hypothetical protein
MTEQFCTDWWAGPVKMKKGLLNILPQQPRFLRGGGVGTGTAVLNLGLFGQAEGVA